MSAELVKVRPDREKYIDSCFRIVDDHPFTPRQAEVLTLLAKGYWQWEIADLMGVSKRTVTHHVVGIFDRIEKIDSIRPEPPNHWIADARDRWLIIIEENE
jgi:DNA-binding NarL/FixJ family response regulator